MVLHQNHVLVGLENGKVLDMGIPDPGLVDTSVTYEIDSIPSIREYNFKSIRHKLDVSVSHFFFLFLLLSLFSVSLIFSCCLFLLFFLFLSPFLSVSSSLSVNSPSFLCLNSLQSCCVISLIIPLFTFQKSNYEQKIMKRDAEQETKYFAFYLNLYFVTVSINCMLSTL